MQPKAKAHLKDIWMAEIKAEADAAFGFFIAACGVKYAPAVTCLTKDRADLLAFHDFPGRALASTSGRRTRSRAPIPPNHHRTTRTKGCLGRQTALAMTHQLMLSAKQKWRQPDGPSRLPEIIQGVEFRDGIKPEIKAA